MKNCLSDPTEAARMKQQVLMRRAMKKAHAKPAAMPPAQSVSQIGTILARRIHSLTGHLPCGECTAEVTRLNGMTPDQVLQERDELAGRMLLRFEQAENWWVTVTRKFPDKSLLAVLKFLIGRAVAEERKRWGNAIIDATRHAHS